MANHSLVDRHEPLWKRLPVVVQLRRSTGWQRAMLITGVVICALYLIVAVAARGTLGSTGGLVRFSTCAGGCAAGFAPPHAGIASAPASVSVPDQRDVPQKGHA